MHWEVVRKTTGEKKRFKGGRLHLRPTTTWSKWEEEKAERNVYLFIELKQRHLTVVSQLHIGIRF